MLIALAVRVGNLMLGSVFYRIICHPLGGLSYTRGPRDIPVAVMSCLSQTIVATMTAVLGLQVSGEFV